MTARVLVISPEVLFPTNAGGRAAVLAQCRALQAAGFIVDVVAFHRHPVSADDARRHEELADHVAFVHRRSLLRSTLAAPLSPYQVSSRALTPASVRYVEEHVPRPGLIIAQQEWTVPAATALWRGSPVPVLLSSHNDEGAYYLDQFRSARGLRRQYLRLERLRLDRALRQAISASTGVVTLSSQDEDVYAGRPVRTIPHALPDVGDRRPGGLPRRSVLFIGAMDIPHTVEGLLWFVQKVWPAVHARVPAAVFDVAGRRASAALRAQLVGVPGVVFHGEAPDLAPLYRDAAVFINPVFLGSGINIKLADPIGLGIPSVTTSTGARGYERLGDALLVSDEPSGFAEDCIALLLDDERSAQLSEALLERADVIRLPAVAALWGEAVREFHR